LLVSQLLQACQSRGFNNASTRSTADLLKGDFMEVWDRLGKEESGQSLASLRQRLILEWLQAKPQAMFASARKANVKALSVSAGSGINFMTTTGSLFENTIYWDYSVKDFGIIFDYEQVTQALLVPDVLQVRHLQKEMAFVTGRFVLCDDGVTHKRDKDMLWEVVKPSDVTLISEVARKNAEQLAATRIDVNGKPGIDAVRNLARLLPIRMVSDYLGVPSGDKALEVKLTAAEKELLQTKQDTFKPLEWDPAGARDDDMYQWIARSFRNLFINLTADSEIRKAGRIAGMRLAFYISRVVDDRRKRIKQGDPEPTNMLDRLVWLQANGKYTEIFTEKVVSPERAWSKGAVGLTSATEECFTSDYFSRDGEFYREQSTEFTGMGMNCLVPEANRRIVANIAGAVAGAGVTVEEAMANTIDILTDAEFGKSFGVPQNANLELLAAAATAAKSSDATRELMAFYKEAMRFAPQAEIVGRHLSQAFSFTDPSRGKVEFKKDALVLVGLSSAMRDSKVTLRDKDGKVGKTLTIADADLFKPDPDFGDTRPSAYYLEMGYGPHECLGKYLAPIQIAEGLRALLLQGKIVRAGKYQRSDGNRGPYADSLPLNIE
jgi:cytochrome P450